MELETERNEAEEVEHTKRDQNKGIIDKKNKEVKSFKEKPRGKKG
jgi:hypothetical protein